MSVDAGNECFSRIQDDLTHEEVVNMASLNYEDNNMTEEAWARFKASILTWLGEKKQSKKFTHQLLNEILQACINSLDTPYVLGHEKAIPENSHIVPTPDFSIVVKNQECLQAYSILNSVIPFEAWAPGRNNLCKAIKRAQAYLCRKFRKSLELHENYDSKMFGICLATDGEQLGIGFASIENKSLHMCSTGNNGLLLWPPKDDL